MQLYKLYNINNRYHIKLLSLAWFNITRTARI